MRFKAGRATSIRARMTLGFAYIKRSDSKDADARLALATQEIRRELRDGEHSLDDPTELLREENETLRATDVAVMILDKENRVVAQSQREVPRWPPRGDAWRTTGFQVGAHTVVIGVEWDEIKNALRERTSFLLGLSTLVVAFSSLGAWILVGRTLSPIDHLARQAKLASTESLRLQLESPSPDAEIARLVATLNDMLARLGETVAARGRFYAAASHELRTPLQALTGHLEVALSRPREAAEYSLALREGHAQAERLTSLVQDLLLLNQLDADTSRPSGVLLDIGDICVSELSVLRLITDERGLTIELSIPDACEIVAPWSHVTMLLRNLLENAVKYAASEGVVRVELRGSTLLIQNDCNPVAGWDAEKYFEPFFRPDASRNSATGGNGLGLAICKAICDANNWTLALSQQEKIVCAVVSFKCS